MGHAAITWESLAPSQLQIFEPSYHSRHAGWAHAFAWGADSVHAGDHAVYPDCRQEFRDADDNAFRLGNWEAERVGYYTPYLNGDKYDILLDGESLCQKLGIDFDHVYARTNTSYKPTPEGWSDYKSASSVERIEAFIKLGRPDPVQYADETGAVDYETARIYVEQVLAEYEKEQLNIK